MKGLNNIMEKSIRYPYIPNSNEKTKKEMLGKVGVSKIEELYDFIPKELRLNRILNLPRPYLSEYELKKHVEGLLNKNISCEEYKNFLGAGCYDHYIPAVCDEINGRSEFLTAYSGDTYSDHGKCQAIFEFTSLMGELLEMDVVNFPTYDGGQAACTSIMMTKRITGRKEVLVPKNLSQDIMRHIKSYCIGMNIITVDYDNEGQLDLYDLKNKISDRVSCVFIQNPTYFGHMEEQGEKIGKIAHENGALFVVYADPSSLGVIEPPIKYGADIACGDIQPLGIHMGYGSGLGGYIASQVEERFVMNYPTHLYGIFENQKGEYGFIRSLPERTSYNKRENGVEFTGTLVGLWAITAAVYLSIMGPDGMYDMGKNILYKSNYAKKRIKEVVGAQILFEKSSSFKEFVVNFDKFGKSVEKINKELLERGIFGGYDLSKEHSYLGQSSLYCITEKTTKEDIDYLVNSLKEILAN